MTRNLQESQKNPKESLKITNTFKRIYRKARRMGVSEEAETPEGLLRGREEEGVKLGLGLDWDLNVYKQNNPKNKEQN